MANNKNKSSSPEWDDDDSQSNISVADIIDGTYYRKEHEKNFQEDSMRTSKSNESSSQSKNISVAEFIDGSDCRKEHKNNFEEDKRIPTSNLPNTILSSVESSVSSAPSPTSLNRAHARFTAKPGAYAVSVMGGYSSPEQIHPPSQQNRPSPDSSILISAELVTANRDIEQGSTPITLTDSTLLVHAELMNHVEPLKPAKLTAFLKSRIGRFLLILLFLIVIGLIVGIILAFRSSAGGNNTTVPLDNDDNSKHSSDHDDD
jgi:hypothetical protein